MYRTFIASAFSVTLMAASLVPGGAFAQVRTELHDPIRGVSFHSIEIEDSSVNALDVIDGSFADSDRIVVGLSAMKFDGTDTVESYVLWIRHEGRRWLDFEFQAPIDVTVDGDSLALQQLRASQPFVGAAGRFFEKIELELSAADLRRLVASGDAAITLRSGSGIVRKQLTADELAHMEGFAEEMEAALVDGLIS
ncbi:MAG: hypothetical protein OEQ25_07560 [Gammaproteobacteria bacterium]|nr:hypothetical protein [Gammaproteobacteria bacterium]